MARQSRCQLECGVGLFPTRPLQEMIRLGTLCEELGYAHIWVGDSQLIWREAYVNLTALALNTRKIALGTAATNPLTRHASVHASAFATLEEYCPGRLTLGIGIGDSSVKTMGMKPAKLADLEKTVLQMRDLLDGKEVGLDNGKMHLAHPPARKVPIYIAGSGPKVLELAGRIADGVIAAVGVADSYIAHAFERVAAGAKAAGRSPEDIQLVLRTPCAVSDDAPAKNAVKSHVANLVTHPLPYVRDAEEQKILEDIRKSYNYYRHMDQRADHADLIPDWLVDRFAIAGTVVECREQLARIAKAGVRQISIVPFSVADAGIEGTLRGFAKAWDRP